MCDLPIGHYVQKRLRKAEPAYQEAGKGEQKEKTDCLHRLASICILIIRLKNRWVKCMKMKKWLVLAGMLVLVVSLALTGCAKKTDLALARVQKAGVMTVGNSPDYPPFETVDDKGNTVGFDVDLLQAMATEMGVKIQLKNLSFDTIVTAVQNGQADIGMSGFSINADRAKQIDFTNPYFVGGQVIVTTKDSGITKKEDLQGKIIATQMGTTCATAAKGITGATVKELEDFNIAWSMLKTGAAKAVVADISVAKEYIAKEGYVQVGEPLSYEETAIVVQKNNPSLVKALNEALAKVKASGTYDQLVAKWELGK